MRQRAKRRKIQIPVKKRIGELEKKKEIFREVHMRRFGEDPFEEVHGFKKWGPLSYTKSGIRINVTKTIRLWCLMIRWTIDNLFIAAFGYVVKVKNWTVRSKTKPEGAIGNYVFTFRERER